MSPQLAPRDRRSSAHPKTRYVTLLCMFMHHRTRPYRSNRRLRALIHYSKSLSCYATEPGVYDCSGIMSTSFDIYARE
jgi:hypothetical protein